MVYRKNVVLHEKCMNRLTNSKTFFSDFISSNLFLYMSKWIIYIDRKNSTKALHTFKRIDLQKNKFNDNQHFTINSAAGRTHHKPETKKCFLMLNKNEANVAHFFGSPHIIYTPKCRFCVTHERKSFNS